MAITRAIECGIANAELTTTIIGSCGASGGTYGVPRVHVALVMGTGIRCSKSRVARLMTKAGYKGSTGGGCMG